MDLGLIILIQIVIAIFLVGLFVYEKNKKTKFLIALEAEKFLVIAEKFLETIEKNKKDYLRNSQKEALKKECKIAFEELSRSRYKILSSDVIDNFKKIYSDLDSRVKEWNLDFVRKELSLGSPLFDDIDGKSLDDQQRHAVVVDEDNNLILAGAGSGKTLTISAKVKYLVDKKNINPKEILLISFTKKAAEEMQERIARSLKIDIEAKTFHKLGLEIISEKYGGNIDIFKDLPKIVTQYFEEVIAKDETEMRNMLVFFGNYFIIPKGFDSLGEQHEHYKSIDLETMKSKAEKEENRLKNKKESIKGEVVKSIEELMIANFLYLRGVKYTYEKDYEYDTTTQHKRQYRPDFYLDEYKIYLEHFGINENGRTPQYSRIEEKKYLDGIKWKRNLHREMSTTMIETYSYYNRKGILYLELEKTLENHGIAKKKVDIQEIYKTLFMERKDKQFKEFEKLIQTFIELFKSKGYSKSDFDSLENISSKAENDFLKERSRLFLSLIKPIYLLYQKAIQESGKIDFNDMINIATNIVRSGTDFKFKYIIIDEYQDISVNRFNLIKEIKKKTNARIMAVGDDWQSIYRFAGSDIDLFTEFSNYMGFSEALKIERTYRNSQELIDIASKFIMMNPKQLVKNLKSEKNLRDPIRILGYNKDFKLTFMKAIEEIVLIHGENTEIMILGRNNFDIDIFENSDDEERTKDGEFKIFKKPNSVRIKSKKYPNIKMDFLTIHRSKGLEAENVIIINLENKIVGFPNKMADDPVLSLVLTDSDDYSFSEERRLFYVAITRTKNRTYLIVPDKNKSVFVEELIKKFPLMYEITDGASIENNPHCPVCQKGYLVLRENKKDGSKFLGCSNYPLCDKTFTNIEILKNCIKCPACDGYMVKRKGTHGEFYGCSNYPHCNQTIRISYIESKK